jgi:general secretion pathway protein J
MNTTHIRATRIRATRIGANRRRGFTLLELMLALTLTAVAAGIASTTLVAARRTSDVVTDHQRHTEADARLRVLLTDMLRHAPNAAMADEPLLSVRPTLTETDAGAALTFLSRGVRAPYGTGPIWTVSLQVIGDSLVLEAMPAPHENTAPAASAIRVALGGVHRLDVRLLAPATALDGARWRADWPLAASRPAAIAIQWAADSARATTLPPLVVALDPLQSESREGESR